MKTKTPIIALSALVLASLALAGCSTPAAVVTTEIAVDRTEGTVRVSSPKNVKLTGLEIITNADGSRSVKVAEYASTADPAALEAVKAQYAALTRANEFAIEVAKAIK